MMLAAVDRIHLARAVMTALAICASSVSCAGASAAWPVIPFPPNASAFSVGEQLTSNGMPMRVQGFVASGQSVAQLADWFRRTLGQPLVENQLGNKLVLGRAQDGYYLSVQIEPGGNGNGNSSKGLLAVSDIKHMNQNREQYAGATMHWLNRWPSGSQMVSHLASDDDAKASSHVVIINGHGESLNRDALIARMAQDGFSLEREAMVDPRAAERLPFHLRGGRTLFFKGEGKEAIATIGRDPQGKTAIVLNTITSIELYKK